RAGVGTGLGIGDVDRVVLRDEDAARPPELTPLVEHTAVLIEDLNAVVLAVADQQPAARIDRDRVRLAQLARSGSLPSPLLHVFAFRREADDAVVLAVAVAVGDEDVA